MPLLAFTLIAPTPLLFMQEILGSHDKQPYVYLAISEAVLFPILVSVWVLLTVKACSKFQGNAEDPKALLLSDSHN